MNRAEEYMALIGWAMIVGGCAVVALAILEVYSMLEGVV